MAVSCETCKHWTMTEEKGGLRDGICRRFPPVFLPEKYRTGSTGADYKDAVHPPTSQDDVCGEWAKGEFTR